MVPPDRPFLERLCADRPGARPGSPGSFLLAAGLVAAGTAIRLALDPWLIGLQFSTLLTAVIVTTFLAGPAAGFAALGMSAVAGGVFLLHPGAIVTAIPSGSPAHSLAAFVLVGGIDVVLVGALRAVVGSLRVGNRALSALVDAYPDAVLAVDRDGRIRRANPRTETLFGYPADELLGREIEDLVPDRLREAHRRHRAGFQSAPRRREMGAGLSLSGRRADGSEFPVDVHLVPLDLDGAPHVVCAVRDVTQQAEAARRLMEAREAQAAATERLRGADELRLWADVFDRAAFGIAIGDPQTETLRLGNPAFAAMRGMTPDEVKGLPIREIYTPDEFPRMRRLVEESDRSGYIACETVHRHKDGSTFPVALTLTTAKKADGTAAYRIASVIDISDRRRAEADLQHAQRLEIFGNLAGGIAHDFNNLLGVILGNLDLADSKIAEAPARTLVHEAIEAALRGAALTRRLLAFARRQPLHPVQLQPSEVVQAIAGLLRRLLGSDVDLRLELTPDVGSVLADQTQLEAALVNLAANARDAMPGGGSLRISTGACQIDEPGGAGAPGLPAGDYVTIAVTDEGGGMSPEVLHRCFEPFFTTKEPGRGTGLGLSTVVGFARQSGGDAQIESTPGLGTTVRLYLPRLAASAPVGEATDQPRGEDPTEPSPAPLPPGRGEALLVVEDDAALRRLTTRELRELGYRVLEAGDASAALEILESEAVSLILTDVVMPGPIDGVGLARVAALRWPACRILLTSGHTERTNLARAGGRPLEFPLLDKPYRLPQLARMLRELIDRVEERD